MRTCYICLPIAGREHDIFERAERAKQEVIVKGYEPICPLDLNAIGEEELKDHTMLSKTAWYMGRDIQTIIERCDAIYCCEGWEYSKGCNVERECAKQYNREILYQEPYDNRFDLKLYEAVIKQHHKMCNKFCDLARNNKHSINSDACSAMLELIKNFEQFTETYFGIKYDSDNHTYKFIEQ